ncbi:MAG: aspartate kinase [Bacteroidales bacterium]|nr:aspartate kinase [Bacteroidales bacterium]
MPEIVVKFGGSSLKTKKDIQKVIDVIISYKQPVIVVVSAFYGITDFLSKAICKGFKSGDDVDKIINELEKRNNQIIQENLEDSLITQELRSETSFLLDELKKLLLCIHYIGELPDFLEDQILAFGEKLSSVIMHYLLKSKGILSELKFPENLPLLTDGEFGNASVNFEACSSKVKLGLSENHIYVIPGFYGVTDSGKITVLGRGGSDYSAASIAHCIGAKYIDVWKDVEGFMSGDPKLIDNPVRLERITYAEAAELAYFGAKILHPRTVEPLLEAHIPIRIFNINNPIDKLHPLSIINSEEVVKEGVVKSVTYSDEFCIIKLRGPAVGIKPGILAKVTGILHREKINISSVLTSQIAINIILQKKDMNRALKLIKSLDLKAVSEVLVLEDISLIAVVGQGMLDNYGVAARIFTSVARQNINIKLSCSGASQVVSYLVVEKDHRDLALREIHHEFFSK